MGELKNLLPIRRRGRMARTLRKATFQVQEGVLDAVRTLVEEGEAPSANAFVEDALRMKLREVRRARLYAAYEEAANDPVFMAEMRATAEAFEGTVADGLGGPREGDG
ncbi:MAG TPA: hypothetical protein VE913_03480, partial [Longimicrobium sp.]|nr:hypothetical protein [Longimicrobium sp.]